MSIKPVIYSYISTTRIDKTYSYYIAIALAIFSYIAIAYTCRMMLVARSPLKLHERICFVENSIAIAINTARVLHLL